MAKMDKQIIFFNEKTILQTPDKTQFDFKCEIMSHENRKVEK